jgi:hypothetical protein
VKVDAVGCMTCRVDHLCPKPVRGLILINHDSYHLYKSAVLSFGYPILLRSVGSEKFMLDALFI